MASIAIARRSRASEAAKLPAPRHFTADEFYCMAKAGIFCEDDRVELVEGEIIQMAPIGSRHAGSVNDLAKWFIVQLEDRAIVSIQNALRLSSSSMPQSDLMLLQPRPDRYYTSLPEPKDVLLLIEVSDTTLRYDRHVKLPLYARAGIPEVWIFDMGGKRVLVHRQPVGDSYQQVVTVRRAGSMSPVAFPDLVLPAAQLLA
jgi:Uma2 family endonuclease